MAQVVLHLPQKVRDAALKAIADCELPPRPPLPLGQDETATELALAEAIRQIRRQAELKVVQRATLDPSRRGDSPYVTG